MSEYATDEKNIFERHPKKTVLIFILSLCLVLLLGAEGILRLTGEQSLVGQYCRSANHPQKKNQFCRKAVDLKKLEIDRTFYFNSDGIFRSKCYSSNINSQGFRGNEFIFTNTTATKILMLGDSFLWGNSANPLSNSFAALVQKEGYYVYNSGIPGVDPMQYKKVAKKYVPLLKPDITAVFLYLGNDLNLYPAPEPEKPTHSLYYFSNVGMIRGYDDFRCYFDSPQEAFEYFVKSRCGKTDGLYEAFIFRTVLGKLFYRMKRRLDKKKVNNYPKSTWIVDIMEEIKAVAQRNNSQFFLFLIRDSLTLEKKQALKRKNKLTKFEIALKLLRNFHLYSPENIMDEDYMPEPNHHFNNAGHKKYADFILKVLSENGFTPQRGR